MSRQLDKMAFAVYNTFGTHEFHDFVCGDLGPTERKVLELQIERITDRLGGDVHELAQVTQTLAEMNAIVLSRTSRTVPFTVDECIQKDKQLDRGQPVDYSQAPTPRPQAPPLPRTATPELN